MTSPGTAPSSRRSSVKRRVSRALASFTRVTDAPREMVWLRESSES
jgi:hypothetical protein